MARLRIRRQGLPELVLELKPAFSILNQLAMAGVAIPHDCGGKALCGTCCVRVVEGSGAIVPKLAGEAEAARLGAVGAGEGERLACQIRSFHDLVLELPGRRTQE